MSELVSSLGAVVSAFVVLQLWGLATLAIGAYMESRNVRMPGPNENIATVPYWAFLLPGVIIAATLTVPTLAWIDERIDLYNRVSSLR